MGLIKGITIKLTGKDGTESLVDNVLPMPSGITQDQQAEWNLGNIRPDYTVSIPKGDDHEWLGARAEFFGDEWEIIALSGVTIDRLTPLSWNRRAFAIRKMSDKVTLCSLRGRARTESGIFQDEYKEVEIDALAHPSLLDGNYERYRSGSKISRIILVRQSDFDDAGTETQEPEKAVVNGKRFVIDSYERIGEVVMKLMLVTEA